MEIQLDINQNNKKTLLLIIALFFSIYGFAQNSLLFFVKDKPHEIKLTIIDTVIVKRDYPFATKINAQINVPDLHDTMFMYNFYRCVGSSDFFYYNKDYYEKLYLDEESSGMSISPGHSVGLKYVLEDENHEIMNTYSDYFSLLYKYPDDDARNDITGIFVNSRQKIIRKKLNWKKEDDYVLAKYEINCQSQIVTLNLLLSVYHNNLPQGEYYLYLFYSFNPGPKYYRKDLENDRTFNGTIVSNKIKLIVK